MDPEFDLDGFYTGVEVLDDDRDEEDFDGFEAFDPDTGRYDSDEYE